MAVLANFKFKGLQIAGAYIRFMECTMSREQGGTLRFGVWASQEAAEVVEPDGTAVADAQGVLDLFNSLPDERVGSNREAVVQMLERKLAAAKAEFKAATQPRERPVDFIAFNVPYAVLNTGLQQWAYQQLKALPDYQDAQDA